MPSKRKKNEARKAKKEGRRESEILLSAHARPSQADILHLDQKAAKCTTCKSVCGKFQLFIARQWPENHSTSFKMRFSAKSPGANGLSLKLKLKFILFYFQPASSASRCLFFFKDELTQSFLSTAKFITKYSSERFFSICREKIYLKAF